MCVHTLPLEFTMLSNHTYLKMRVSSECLLHVCDPEIVVQNSVLSLDFFLYFNGLLSRVQSMMDCCCCCRCRRCCFPGGRDFYCFVEATVSRCMLEGLTFVSTLFESCEPYSWYSTECLERFEVHIIEVLFLLAQFLNLNSPSTNCQNSSGNSPEYSMIVLVLGDNFEFFLQFCWSKSTDTFPFLLIFLMGSLAMKCFCHGSWDSRLRMFHPCGNS